ncbi:hypothetical protein ECOLIN_06500 [Escherichia coli Nissle 1917]|nr:hypothetical protein ECOLIN_06500 [Escherichia coli Nissle 1917]
MAKFWPHSRGWTGITIDDCWKGRAILLRQKQKKLIMLPSETMIWQPEFTDKTLSRKPGAVHSKPLLATLTWVDWYNNRRLLERQGHTPPAEAEKAYYASIGNDDLAA